MSAGDKIECSSLDDAFEYMDVLIRDGYGVELNHGKGGTVLTIREVPEDERGMKARTDPLFIPAKNNGH